ncbi:MAG: FixH family protein [Chloroflexi bacterium]|nr:FixH family protein [Chloroflexota bacterium]
MKTNKSRRDAIHGVRCLASSKTVRQLLIILLLLTSFFASVKPVVAHANLVRSDPPANTSLDVTPAEIRLWFTEPLEPEFSRFTLRDSSGDVIETPESQVDSSDPTQMFMQPGELPDGVYTVAWRVISAADGHSTQGSFSFGIGVDSSEIASIASTEEIPPDEAGSRWLNLFSMALGVGGIGFMLMVWRPAIGAHGYVTVKKRMMQVVWLGWFLIGITTIFVLLVQAAISSDSSIIGAMSSEFLDDVILSTRFGEIWQMRVAAWIVMGAGLILMPRERRAGWIVLAAGLVITLSNSLNSHAGTAEDEVAGIANDWLHLTATALWVGGLVQFGLVALLIWRTEQKSTPLLAELTAHFSNYARIAVLALLITGIYSAWLLVGSVDALTGTQYGELLIIKLLLIMPLLAIAAINLIWTQRNLNAGKQIWERHLIGLIGVEIALTVGVLAMVGSMTSVEFARSAHAKAQAVPIMPEPSPYAQEDSTDGMNIGLSFAPGWVGDNDFAVTLTDRRGNPIEDASLIRMRFKHMTENLGESEIRPEHQGDGVYTISAPTLSVEGEWRIRLTIQRPGEFDTVIDFEPTVTTAPAPIPPPPIDTTIDVDERSLAMSLASIVLLAVGGWTVAASRRRAVQLIPASGVLLLGLVFGVSAFSPAEQASIFADTSSAPAWLAISSGMTQPYIVTESGQIFQPGNTWRSMGLNARVNDVFIDTSTSTVWAATDSGVYSYNGAAWKLEDETISDDIIVSHGYLFAMTENGLTRGPVEWHDLNVDGSQWGGENLLMMSDHSHVLFDGSALFRSNDLGLSWEPLEIDQIVYSIFADENEYIHVVTDTGIMRYFFGEWEDVLPLPDDTVPDKVVSYGGRLYAIAAGHLYRESGEDWAMVELDADGIVLDIATQYAGNIWALDDDGTLWSSADGLKWASVTVMLE